MPSEEPTTATPTTQAPPTEAPTTASPTQIVCEEGEVLLKLSWTIGDHGEINSENAFSLTYTQDGSDPDAILDSNSDEVYKCVDPKLMSVNVAGDLTGYIITVESDQAPLSVFNYDLDDYKYYHPTIGFINETVLNSECVVNEDYSEVMVLRIAPDVCVSAEGDATSNIINFSQFPNLIYLKIEDGNQFQNQEQFELTLLSKLEIVRIGANCFNLAKDTAPTKKYPKRKFIVSYCNNLAEISIGAYSFSDFSGGFELNGLTSLAELYIGKPGVASMNFYRADNFMLRCKRAYFCLKT